MHGCTWLDLVNRCIFIVHELVSVEDETDLAVNEPVFEFVVLTAASTLDPTPELKVDL